MRTYIRSDTDIIPYTLTVYALNWNALLCVFVFYLLVLYLYIGILNMHLSMQLCIVPAKYVLISSLFIMFKILKNHQLA